MADEARATVGVDADTEGAKSGIKSLGDIFGGLGGSITGSLFSFNQLAQAGENIATIIRTVSNTIQALVSGTWDLVKGFAGAGDEIFTLSRRTGLSAQALSAFKYVGEQTGSSMEAISGSVFKMGVNIAKSGKQTEEAFKAIGTSSKELKSLKPEDQFAKIMAGLQGIPDAGQRAMVGVAIFGKGFQSIAQLVDEDLGGLMKNAKAFGLVMSDELAAAGDRFGDTMSDLGSLFTGLKNIIGAALLPIVNAFIGTLRDELLVVFGMVKDAFGPLFSGLGSFQKGLVDTGQSADFHTKVLRTMVTVMAFVIDAFAGLVRAVGIVQSAYMQFRIVTELIKAAFYGLVVGIQEGAKFILQALARITPGDMGRSFQKWADEVGGRLKETQQKFWEAKDSADAFNKAGQSMQGTFGGFADKLNVGSKALREAGAEYQGVASKIDPAKAAVKGFNDEIDLTPDKLKGLAKKIDDWKTSTKELSDEIELAWLNNESITQMFEAFGKKAEEASAQGRRFGQVVPEAVQQIANALRDKNLADLMKRIADSIERSSNDIIGSIKDVGTANAEINDKSIAAVKKYGEVRAKDAELEMSAQQKRLADIEISRTAELAAIVGIGYAYDTARAAINAFYDHQRQKAQETTADVIKRTREEDAERKASALRQAAAYEFLYRELKAGGKATAKELKDAFDRMEAAQVAAGLKTKTTWSSVLSTLSNDFAQMAQIGGDTFSQIARNVGMAVKAVESLARAMELTGLIKVTGGASQGVAVAGGSAAAGTAIAATTTNVLALVSAWVGVAIAVYSFIKALDEASKANAKIQRLSATVKQLGDDFKTASNFSDQLGQQIDETFKKLTGRDVAPFDLKGVAFAWAEALHLSDIIKELGGLSALTAEQLTGVYKKADLLFDLIKQGGVTGAQATAELDKNLVAFGQHAVETTGLVDKFFLSEIKKAQDLGIELANVNKFIVDQLKAGASGMNDLLLGLQVSATAAAQKAARDTGKFTDEEIGKLRGTVQITQSESEGLAAAIAGDFNSMIARGVSFKDALTAIQPALDTLKQAMKDSGVTGGEAFDFLQREAAIASDAITGPLVSAITGAGASLRGLNNSGILTQEMFRGITQTATQSYNKIVAQTHDENAAMATIRPTLQTIWELQKEYGYAVDEATQALIDQAVKAGEVGAKHQSAAARTADSMERVVTVLEKMAEKMGVTLPAAADQMASKIGGSVDKVGKRLDGTPWDQWAADAEDAAKRAQDAVESVAGNSPSGIELVSDAFITATQAARSFSSQVIDQMQAAKQAVESVALSKSDPSLDIRSGTLGGKIATSTQGAGLAPIVGGDEVTVNLNVEALDSSTVETWFEKKGLPALVTVLGKGGKNLTNLQGRLGK